MKEAETYQGRTAREWLYPMVWAAGSEAGRKGHQKALENALQEAVQALVAIGPPAASVSLEAMRTCNVLRPYDQLVWTCAAQSLLRIGGDALGEAVKITGHFVSESRHAPELEARAVAAWEKKKAEAIAECEKRKAETKGFWARLMISPKSVGPKPAPSPDHLPKALLGVELLSAVGPLSVLALPDLIEGLVHADWRIRKGSAVAIGECGPDAASATRVLEKVVSEDPDGAVREAAREALRKIDGEGGA